VTNPSGSLPSQGTTQVTVSINSAADNLENGYYEDTVNFINTTNGDGNTTRTVALTVGVPTVQYSWDLETDPGWSTTGLWAFGQPTGGGGQYGGPDPRKGYTGSNVYGYNLNGDYENYLSERHLTTTAIDCSDLGEVTLSFQRWLGVEQPAYDHAYLRVSNDGSNWTTVWQNPSVVEDYSWLYQEFDVSSIADNEPTVYIRWTMGTTDSSWQYCGWNIDDVEVQAVPLVDCNGNNLVDHLDFDNCDGSAWCDDCNDNGILDTCDIASETSENNWRPGLGIPDECEIVIKHELVGPMESIEVLPFPPP